MQTAEFPPVETAQKSTPSVLIVLQGNLRHSRYAARLATGAKCALATPAQKCSAMAFVPTDSAAGTIFDTLATATHPKRIRPCFRHALRCSAGARESREGLRLSDSECLLAESRPAAQSSPLLSPQVASSWEHPFPSGTSSSSGRLPSTFPLEGQHVMVQA